MRCNKRKPKERRRHDSHKERGDLSKWVEKDFHPSVWAEFKERSKGAARKIASNQRDRRANLEVCIIRYLLICIFLSGPLP